MSRLLLLGSVFALLSATAQAEPLRVTNGTIVHLALAGKREAAHKVGSTPKGWRLELDGVGGDARVEAIDVTKGAGARYSLEVRKGGVAELDRARFVAGHAYRLQAVRGDKVMSTTLIYLQPPAGRRVTTVVLEEGEGDDGMVVADKGLL